MMRPPQLEVIELKSWLDEGRHLQLVDVREPHEWDICKIAQTTHFIPLAHVPSRAVELDPDQTTVLLCRSGKRSLLALATLANLGFSDLHNLKGGVLAWSDQVDSSLKTY